MWETISGELVTYLRKLVRATTYDIILIEHSQMAWIAPILRQISPKSKLVLDAHNLEYRIYETWLPYASAVDRDQIRTRFELLKNWEHQAWPWFDAILTVSTEEQKILQDYGVNRTYLIPTGGGIDPEKYAPKYDHIHPMDILYIGSMNWYPNIHGLVWFIKNVYPIIQEKRPGTGFNIVGTGIPSTELFTVIESNPNIKFWGFQKDDVSFFHNSKVFIVPLWIGAGARVKVITAWASKIPVVSTKFGAEGSNSEHGKNIMLEDEPQKFADAIIKILDNPQFGDYLAENAFDTFYNSYTTEHCADLLISAYKEIAYDLPR